MAVPLAPPFPPSQTLSPALRPMLIGAAVFALPGLVAAPFCAHPAQGLDLVIASFAMLYWPLFLPMWASQIPWMLGWYSNPYLVGDGFSAATFLLGLLLIKASPKVLKGLVACWLLVGFAMACKMCWTVAVPRPW